MTKENHRDISALDLLLAITPIPVVGEKKAAKVINQMLPGPWTDVPGYSADELKNINHGFGFLGLRAIAYAAVPYGLIQGAYALSQMFQ